MDKLRDNELVHLYKNGNESAFVELLKRHKKKVFKYLFNICHDKDIANDLLQDTLIKTILSIKNGKYNGSKNFISWIIAIAHNNFIDYLRKKDKIKIVKKIPDVNGRMVDVINLIKLKENSIEDDIIKKEINDDVIKLLNFIPIQQREIIILRFYYEMSFKEIGELKKIRINTAIATVRRGIINLRKIINKKELILFGNVK